MSKTRGDGPPLIKELILVVAGVVALAIFYLLPANKTWILDNVWPYWKDIKSQRNNLNLVARKNIRYGSAYIQSRKITAFFERKGIQQQVLVLVPGTRYFSNNKYSYEVPEPSVFYYYTGLKTVRPADANAADANWWVHLQNGQLVMDSVTDKKTFADSIQVLKKTDASL